MAIRHCRLNEGWNAEPNAPDPFVAPSGPDVVLRFLLNYQLYQDYKESDLGILRFKECSRFRYGPTNDEGWFRGQCRFGKSLPWGEIYLLGAEGPEVRPTLDWEQLNDAKEDEKHFLFYFRDGTFECFASEIMIEATETNALWMRGAQLPMPLPYLG